MKANPNRNEAAVVRSIINYLKKQDDVWWVKFHGNRFTRNGVPDILGCCNSYFFAIEVKRPIGGKVTLNQEVQISEIKKASGRVIIATDLKEVKEMIEGLRNA